MLRRGGNTRHSRGGPALLISSYHADARASSHVNLEIVPVRPARGALRDFRDAAAQQGAKKRTAGRAGFERTRHAHGGRQTPRRTERKAFSGPDPLAPTTKIKTRHAYA